MPERKLPPNKLPVFTKSDGARRREILQQINTPLPPPAPLPRALIFVPEARDRFPVPMNLG